MSPEEAEFVDRLGLFMEMLGGPRTMGRVYERLEDFRDFCEFSAQDYRDELMQRCIEYRGKRTKR